MPSYQPRDTERARALRRQGTPAERRLWRRISRSQLGVRFNRQMPVGPYFVDFLCREHRLVVEVDGHSHDVDPAYDEWRDAALRRLG